MSDRVNIASLPPRIYVLPIVALAFGVPYSTLYSDITRSHTCKHFGRFLYRGPRKGPGQKRLCITAAQVAQYLSQSKSYKGWITTMQVTRTLKGQIAYLAKKGALPWPQKHIEDTPFEELKWISNYAHHGGRTPDESL